jgi:flagellar hook-length control protein FliK
LEEATPVLSVTSEAAASVSLQTAPPKPIRPDQPQRNDGFGALVDSSLPADSGTGRAPSMARPPSAPQRRADDAAATAGNRRALDASGDQAPKSASDDRAANAQPDSGANAPAGSDANSASNPGATPAKPGAAKTDTAKADEKQTSDTSSTSDSSGLPQSSGAIVPTPNVIAVAIPVVSVPTDTPATPASTGNATPPPLAIATAAIAASTAPPATAVAASSAQGKNDTGSVVTGSAVDAAPAVAPANAAAAPAPGTTVIAETTVQPAIIEPVATPVKQQATQTDATATTSAALTADVAATAPFPDKSAQPKAPAGAPSKTAGLVATNGKSVPADPSAPTSSAPVSQTNSTQAAITDNPEGNNNSAGAKADATANAASASAASPSPHDRQPVTTAAHTPTDSSDIGAQPTGPIQQQLPPTPATAAPVGPLTVAVATGAPVPLSGLALEIAATARSGKSRFEIRLDPADLGRIDVRIDVDRNGQVTSHLTVEKPETLSMLRQDAPQLQRALDDAGFKTGDGGLQFSLRDQSSSGQNNGNQTGRNPQRLVITNEEAIPTAIAGRNYGRLLGSSSGVDIRV